MADDRITSLGVVTIDQVCPLPVEPEEEKVGEEANTDDGLVGWFKGLDTVIQIAIVIFPILFLLAIIRLLLYLRSRNKKDMKL